MTLFKKSKTKKTQPIDQLITEFSNEKDKNKKVSICYTMLSNLDQTAPSKALDLLIKAISPYEKSVGDELTIWTKIMIDLVRLFPYYKLDYQNRILNAIASHSFNDNFYKINFINAFTAKGKEILGISNAILIAFIEFILFDNVLKEDNEEILELLKHFINKIGPINIEGYLINFLIDTLCLLTFNYNIQFIFSSKPEDNDKLTAKIIICMEILEACLDGLQIMKKNIISVVFFLVILFNIKDSKSAFSFYKKFVLHLSRLFEIELIDLLSDKNILKHLSHLDKMLINNYMMFQFIFQFNGDKIKSVSNDYIVFQSKYQPNKDQFNDIILITQLSALRLIKEFSQFCEFKIPFSIILNSFLLVNHITLYFNEIIENLEMFIDKFKRDSSDNWEYAFDIIDVLIKNLNSSSLSTKESGAPYKSYQSAPIASNGFQLVDQTPFFLLSTHTENLFQMASPSLQRTKIEELLKKIIYLCIKRVLIGKEHRIKASLLLFSFISDDFLSLWKIKLALSSSESFSKHIPSVIEKDILQNKANVVKLSVFDHIRNYYYNNYNKEKEALLIEKLIQVNHMKIVEVSKTNEKMLVSYSSFLVFMLKLANNNEFFFDIINQLLSNSNYESINEFLRKTLLLIINKLIRLREKDKLSFFNSILYNQISFLQENSEKLTQNTNLVQTIIYLFKQFFINENNEIEVKLDNHRQGLFSFFRSNFEEMKQAEMSFSNKNLDFGYLALNLNDFYSFFIYTVEQVKENTKVFSDLLSLFNKQLRHIFFFKHLDILKIILIFSNQLLIPEYISKYLNKEMIIKQITQLFLNINFHLNTDLLDLLPPEAKIDKQGYNTLLNIDDPHFSMKNNIITLIISVTTPMIASSTQLISIENKPLISKSSKEEIISSKLSITDICTNNISLEMNMIFINQFVSLLESYFFSLIDWSPKEKSLNTFFSTKNRDGLIEQHKKYIYGSNELVGSINGFITLLRKSKVLITFDYDFAFSLLKTLFVIKELIMSFGEEKMVEVIYLILCIVWPGYEKELTESFKGTYKFGFLNDTQATSSINEKKEITEDKLKRLLLVEWFGDIVIMFFIERIKTGNQLLNIMQKVFNKQSDNRQLVFIELVKWNLIIKGNRDNLLRNTDRTIKESKKNKIDCYFDNWNLITLTKIQNDSHKVTIRNPISNITLTMKSPSSIWKEEKDQLKTLKGIINSEKITALPQLNINDQPSCISSQQNSKQQQLNQKEYSYNSVFRTLSRSNFTNNQIDLASLPNEIDQLDLSTVYNIISCGIIFYPNIHQITDRQLMKYNGKVSLPYILFINSLGNTIEISNKNLNIFLMGQDHHGREGKYAIYHQDSMFQLIFHCSNLIPSNHRGEIRKKILGNDYINIIWMDNCYLKFIPSTIKTNKTFIYIVIYPYSSSHYYVKLKFQALNNETDQLTKEKQDVIKMIKKFLQTKIVIFVDKDCYALSNYIKNVIVIATSLIEYNMDKMIYSNVKLDVCDGGIHRNALLFRYQALNKLINKE